MYALHRIFTGLIVLILLYRLDLMQNMCHYLI